jgi:hypothetical protein
MPMFMYIYSVLYIATLYNQSWVSTGCIHTTYYPYPVYIVVDSVTVGYLFEGQIENGGDGFLMGLHRTQSIKIAQRIQREGKKDDNRKKTVHCSNDLLPPLLNLQSTLTLILKATLNKALVLILNKGVQRYSNKVQQRRPSIGGLRSDWPSYWFCIKA